MDGARFGIGDFDIGQNYGMSGALFLRTMICEHESIERLWLIYTLDNSQSETRSWHGFG
jgi:hypothetical protein